MPHMFRSPERRQFTSGKGKGCLRMVYRRKPKHMTLPYQLYVRDMQPVMRRDTMMLSWRLFLPEVLAKLRPAT
jgi:hypothetical protein